MRPQTNRDKGRQHSDPEFFGRQLRMRRRDFIALVGGVAPASFSRAFAQRRSPPVVGFLSTGSPGPAVPLLAAFRDALAEAGFVEGRTLAIEHRWAEGNYDRL